MTRFTPPARDEPRKYTSKEYQDGATEHLPPELRRAKLLSRAYSNVVHIILKWKRADIVQSVQERHSG